MIPQIVARIKGGALAVFLDDDRSAVFGACAVVMLHAITAMLLASCRTCRMAGASSLARRDFKAIVFGLGKEVHFWPLERIAGCGGVRPRTHRRISRS